MYWKQSNLRYFNTINCISQRVSSVSGTPGLLKKIQSDKGRRQGEKELMKATFQRITGANVQNPQTVTSEPQRVTVK